MKLNELIKSHTWLSVEMIIVRLYPDQKDMIDDYRSVYEKLQLLEPEDNDMEIVIQEYNDTLTLEDATFIDVSGREKLSASNTNSQSFALEFESWKNWLGMDLSAETVDTFPDLEIIAHCLYEMTFISYNEEEIQEKLRALEKAVDELKTRMNDEKTDTTLLS